MFVSQCFFDNFIFTTTAVLWQYHVIGKLKNLAACEALPNGRTYEECSAVALRIDRKEFCLI